MKLLRKNFGFTMVEVIIVVGLVGILGAVSGTYVVNSFKNSEKLAEKTVVQASVTALMNDIGATIKEAQPPVVEINGNKYKINQMKDNSISVVIYEFDETEKVVNKITDTTITYENIESLDMASINDGTGAKISIVGEDQQYSLTSKYYTRNTVVACAHEWSTPIEEKEATCEENGKKVFECTKENCDAIKEESIDALGHRYDNWIPDPDRESTHHIRECLVCSDKDEEKHNPWLNDTTCGKCGYTKDITTPPAGGENPEVNPDPPENVEECTEHEMAYAWDDKGHAWACKKCGYVERFEDHRFKTTINPWEWEKDVHYKECQDCHYKADLGYHNMKWALENVGLDGEYAHMWTCTQCAYTETQEAHNFRYAYDDAGHILACTICGAEKEKGNHKLIWRRDENNHVQACETCAYSTIPQSHQFKARQDKYSHWDECIGCGYVKNKVNHEAMMAWAHDSQGHARACKECGYIDKLEDHTLVNGYCITCGYNSNIGNTCEHDYAWASDELGHKKACKKCGDIIESGEHSALVWKENDEYHYRECEICEYKTDLGYHNKKWAWDDEVHYWICQTCTLDPVIEAHDDAYAFCEIGHQLACRVCGTPENAMVSHEYEWKTSADGTKHYKECKTCGYRIDENEHSIVLVIDEDKHERKCMCGYVEESEEHNFGEMQKYPDAHYQVCEGCTKVINFGEHIENNGKCTICDMPMQ